MKVFIGGCASNADTKVGWVMEGLSEASDFDGYAGFTFMLKPKPMRFPKLAEEVSKRVKAIMIRLELTPEEMAYLCHLDRDTMYAILNAKHNMCDYVLYKICHYTDTDIREFTKGLWELTEAKYDARKPKYHEY